MQILAALDSDVRFGKFVYRGFYESFIYRSLCTVYDYYFVIGENESEDTFVEMKDAPERVKSGDVYKTATYIIYPDHRIKGDVNGDGKITAVDASAVLIEFAELSADGKGTFTPSQFAAADVNNDGKITAVDASSILRYYAALSGNETPEWT